MTVANEAIARHVLACVLLLFCLDVAAGQSDPGDPGLISKRPFVIKTFDHEKAETTIRAFLIDPQSDAFRGMLVYSPDHPPPDIRLHAAEYTYSGTMPARPTAIAFVFVPQDKYKTTVSFSVTADGTVVQEGEATLREWCCVEVNGHKANPQHIVVSVSMETFEQLRKANKVEFKLTSKRGKYSFKLDDYKRKCLTALADTIK